MAELETLYTVEDIASMTNLTTRTIRTYLRDGLLKGRKLGGQWRFTTEDIQRFMNQGKVATDMAKEQKQAVLDFIDGVNTDVSGTVQTCTIVDLYVPQEEAKTKSDRLCELINITEQQSYLSYKYNYDKESQRARFILFASPDFISKAMEVLK